MTSKFYEHYRGYFGGVLHWQQLDELWLNVRKNPQGWYAYFINENLPENSLSVSELEKFIIEVDTLLHRDHEHDYCGIVYADSKEQPQMIKIFDPNNLGSSCGSCGKVIPPRWLLTKIKPEHINDDSVVPANRKRWWDKIFKKV
jgi:hypothetical protein